MTWNVNSVRLRLGQVVRVLNELSPDVLCLQETKCPDDKFPSGDFAAAGYPFIARVGFKGLNGVAVLSKYPFRRCASLNFCERQDARHISVILGDEAGEAAGLTINNFYVPAGGDVPDPEENPKFAHKLRYLAELRRWSERDMETRRKSILVGDLNIAPLTDDVWSHRQLLGVVSHSPVETETLEALRTETGWLDAPRILVPPPHKLFTWWSYRSTGWRDVDKGRRLDHIWTSQDLKETIESVAVLREARSWEPPSDHAPLQLVLQL
jgi:exodeoxyribonuclease-3